MKNRHFWKRGIGLLAALALLVGLLPMGALAAPRATETETETETETASAGSVVGTAYSEDPDAYEIYPVPHSVVTAKAAPFTLTDEVNVVVGEGVDTYTTDFVREILTRFGHTMTTSAAAVSGKSNIILAIHGDDDPITPSAYPDLFTAADKYDPYLLRAEASSGNQNGVITIIGKNADCVYYGVATLQMMFTSFNGEKFLPVQIEDYSNTVFRGFIEGFYGGFDYTGRESQMRAIRDVKGNMYVFASKTDPYHGSNWSGLYPTDELNQIKHLVDVGKETKVNYTWSVHIGKGRTLNGIDDGTNINETLYTERLDLLKAKFQQLYDIGVRSFNVLNDDYNSGTYRVQVRFLNDINAWLKEKGDCMPLIYCCQGYNTAWAGNGAELQALQDLDDDIYLYWTGSDVNSPITQASVDWAATRSNQPVVTWLNYPCSEHAGGRGIFLGNISHYMKDADGLTGQYGLLSNGISSPEANKVAYFQLFSWCWNRDNYTDYLEELWEDCFKYLQPEVYESYLTIARNVSNCPDSGRIPQGFPESEYIKDALAAVQTGLLAGKALADIPEAQGLLNELDNILAAVADFRANCENTALKAELEPWLKSLTDVVTAAIKGMRAADMLTDQDVSGAWNDFSEGAVALGKWNSYRSSNPNVSNNVKAGSKRLQPFANAVLGYVETAMAQQFTPGSGGIEGAQSFYAVLHGVERKDDANSAKMFDGNTATYASYHDGTGGQQQAGDYYGVDLGTVKLISAVDILQGNSDTDNDYFHKAALEYSTDGEHWTTLVTRVNSRHIHVDGLDVAARYVRLRLLEKGYGSKQDYWTHIREFAVTEKAAELLYTNADNVEAQEETSGVLHTLTVSAATLASGEYVGIQLPALTGIQTVATGGALPSGVVLEYSVNGETWTQGAPTSTTLMGYIRLRATATATLENVTLTVSEPVTTALSFVSSNVGVSAGSWNNVVDGDRSTLVHTNTRQAYGQYAIFDLSGVQPIHDVTVWIPENDSDIPHNLDVFVGNSADPEGEWELLAELRDNHYDMDVPHRYFRCNGEGAVTGRYIKLAIANIEALNWFKINELEVNTTVAQEEPLTAEAATSGNAGDAVDGDLLTFFTPDGGAAGSWTKYLQAPTTFTAATILRGMDGATAKVEVQKNNAWQQVGTLSESATTVQLSEVGAITALRVTWTAADVPAIAEVILSGAAAPAGDAPALYPNIYEQPANPDGVTVANGTALENVPLPDKVAVVLSGSSSEVSVPVAWSCESYDPATAGDYTFTGAFPETFNPGCFALSATVTVRPAAGGTTSTGSLLPSAPTDNVNVWASGQEVDSQNPQKAIDGQSGTLWSGNKMKNKDGSTLYETLENAVSWITVDLGENVESISQIVMNYNANVWPLDYYIQAGDSTITYDGYTTPGDTTTYSTDAGHAKDAAGWTTIYHGTRTAASQSGLTLTVNSTDFTTAVPSGTRYLRLYFTAINPYARAGTGIGLKELTVNGTRTIPPSIPNVASVAPVTATGVTGEDWAELDVPTHVVATLADGSTVRLPVTWDSTGYNATSTTAQTFTGTLTLTDDLTNTGNVTASLTVTLTAPPTPIGYAVTPTQVTAPQGTAFGDLELPAQAVVQFSNGEARTLNVAWSDSGYDPTSLADQDIAGTVTLPWNSGTYSVTILVRLDPILSSRVTVTPQTVTLYANEGHANHTAVLTAEVGPENASDKTVVWRTSNANVATVSANGTVTAMGVGTATITATAHDGSRASDTCTVTVKEALGGSVSIAKPSADEDYYFGSELSAALNQLTPQAAQDSLTYEWKRGSVTVGTGETYTPVEDDIGKALTVTVTAADPYDGSVTSAPVTIQKAPGPEMRDVLSSTDASDETAADGTITGLFKGQSYEYLLWNDEDTEPGEDAVWTSFCDETGTEEPGPTPGSAVIAGLGKGTYLVRRAGTDTHAPGPYRAVTVSVEGAVEYELINPTHFDGGNVETRRSQVPEDATVTLKVRPDTGYELSALTVTPADGSGDITPTETSTAGTYTFRMPASDVTVSATFVKKTYTITHDLEHISCDMEGAHSHTVEYNDKPTVTLKPDAGYDMPQTLKVYTKASVEADPENPVEFNGYTYRPNANGTATLTFSSGITQDVVVSGAGVRKTYTIDHQLTDLTCDMGGEEQHKVAHGEALTIQLTAAAGYHLPAREQVTITMNGAAFTDFEYTRTDETHGQIVIAEGKITGELVVAAAGVKDPTPLTGVTIRGTVRVGETLSANVRPSTATVAYQWLRVTEEGETEIENAVEAEYAPVEADLGASIKVTVTANGDYTGTLTSDPVGPVVAAVTDKGDLRAAYRAALAVTNDGYTAASWNAFQEAVDAAKAVLDDPDSTQTQINDALTALAAAQNGLTKPVRPSSPGSSVPAETTKTETKEDGTKVTTTTKPDGTVTETVEEPDGTKAVTETKPDGTTTATVEEPDGTKAVTETKPDGSKTATVEQADGTKSETVVTAEGDATITVTDPEGEEIAKVEIPATIPEPEDKFVDLDKAPWAEEAINKVAGLELVKGIGGNKYDPVTPMTRGQLATVLHRLSNGKTDYAVAFKDVQSNRYYTEGVAWAAKANVVKGISEDIFAPDQIITREQLAVMLARYAKLIGMSTKANAKSLDQFADGDSTGAWAVDGMAWCVENGILKGKGANTLDPTADVSRAEVAVMLDRFIALIK